jgi:photosystem II stability/assembly factor-like uncharacterized protein
MKRSLIALALFPLLLAACTGGGGETASLNNTHVHGLAVDRGDSSRIYIATHNGLLVWQDGQGLSSVGSSRDDFMGFSAHPTDPQMLFRSGHPAGGGNLGFQVSPDEGETWDKVSNGSPTGPADFHTMTVHPANPEHIYGWFGGRIHSSLDGGDTWTVLPQQMGITSIAGDPTSDTTIYVGTQNGLLMSTDQGKTWTQMTTQKSLGTVLDIEPDAATDSLLLVMQDGRIARLSRNSEGGWAVKELGTLPDAPMHLALDPKNAETMYAFSEGHTLYKSSNGGQTWQKIFQ